MGGRKVRGSGPVSTIVPTIERTICQQKARARISYVRTSGSDADQRDSNTRRTVDAPGGRRQKAAKSCSPTKGSAARRRSDRSSGSGTHHAYRARNGSGSGRFTIVYR